VQRYPASHSATVLIRQLLYSAAHSFVGFEIRFQEYLGEAAVQLLLEGNISARLLLCKRILVAMQLASQNLGSHESRQSTIICPGQLRLFGSPRLVHRLVCLSRTQPSLLQIYSVW